MSKKSTRAAGDLFASGWLSKKAAADALGITERQLERRARNGEVKSREICPGTGIRLYEVAP